MTNAATAPNTIVLIHGLWMTPRSWEEWVPYFEGKGYRVLTPTYPGFEVEVEALREDPEPIATATVPATARRSAPPGDVGELQEPRAATVHSSGAPCSWSQALATRFCALVSHASTTMSCSSSGSSRARSGIRISTAG
jgi:Alpha/beta hydrolase family